MSRGALLTLFLFFAVGLGLGLYIGWIALPIQYTDTAPAALRQPLKDDAVLMIAALYAQDHDPTRARTRLAELGLKDPAAGVAQAAQRALAAQAPEADLRRLAGLAGAFGPLPVDLQPYYTP